MKEETSQQDSGTSFITPVYILNLYSKWQRLDIVDTLKKFFLFERDSSSNNLQS